MNNDQDENRTEEPNDQPRALHDPPPPARDDYAVASDGEILSLYE